MTADKPKNTPSVDAFFAQMAALETEREAALKAGIPALKRLAEIAKRDTGQAVTVRRLLLGLYNGGRWPFDLVTLRGLDRDLFEDCMTVIRLDARATLRDIHQYFSDGGALFRNLAELEGSTK